MTSNKPKMIYAALFFTLFVACAHHPGTQSGGRLESTPRHDEWVTIDSSGRPLHAYVVYPQVKNKAAAVLVIHENRGLTDWVRTVADRLAEEGFIAIAPDLLSGAGPSGGRTSDFATQDAAREAISKLPREQVLVDLRNVASYIRSLPSANGTLSVAGFCWGGARTWDLANSGEKLAGGFVFYGTGPKDEAGVGQISAPVFGFYGGDDARVNATIPESEKVMTQAGKNFQAVIYPGAGHAFMRLGEETESTAANREAREAAWKRWLALLRG